MGQQFRLGRAVKRKRVTNDEDAVQRDQAVRMVVSAGPGSARVFASKLIRFATSFGVSWQVATHLSSRQMLTVTTP